MANTPTHLFKSLFSPRSFKSGLQSADLAKNLTEYFGAQTFVLNSGRSAIYLALKSLGIGSGDQVLLQAYTCNAVPNPILWTGAVPVYVDIESDSLNMDPDDLVKKITPNSKVVIVQHTFGNPAKVREILKIAETHHLKVIEDCAHSLGAKLDGKLLGTFGDMSIVSFGREKVISSLTGGALVVNDAALVPDVEKEFSSVTVLPKKKIYQEIFNYFLWRVLFRRIINWGWGSSLVKALYHFDQINVVTSQKELSGLKPKWYPSLLPDVFAEVCLRELPKIDSYNRKRIATAQIYLEKVSSPVIELVKQNSGIYLRVSALSERLNLISDAAKKTKIGFGNWYNSVIYPETAHLSRLGYKSGSCPVAEKTAVQTFNLPNYLGIKEAEIDRVIKFLNDFH